ncbi:2-aminoethanethiol dioxygenase isoform X2 [Odontomachus brunneus]|uniref:2-aminoethanethiol dioxygenase isoform X2 n=1 Tax=Odontomachus brunneus TaxID=486640 RepID=UPI0013F289B0|nr:2-aminoethanethiol dioxygenase isoform X2 [Odontomachus brunneus]XP_032666390.1 2-aminoethanethiol dioxygenase isoform X2 [Odontomachus brunneus]XP_032666391.1 2-aminoethanethiol dioxygenase isoform X2 [Odontomachus brunneus]
MASAIEVLAKQAMKTFGDRRSVSYRLCQKNLDKLWSLMNKLTAEDVKLDKNVLDYVSTQPAPMCVMDILENKDITIAIFILKHGVTMPMHDHPGMHGLLKVISGIVELNSYSLKTKSDHIIKANEEIAAIRHRPITLHSNSSACILTPSDKNLHEISCIKGPAAFLDILSPPYEVNMFGHGPRPCTYFKAVKSKLCTESTDVIEEVHLSVVESPPDFYSSSLEYIGPSLKTYND